jgi:flagellar hook-associated protein 1 FlgK
VQSNATAQATQGVTSANTLLQGIATLNTQIASLEAGDPGSATDLRDQREADEEKLAALVPITVTEQATGEDTITTPSTTGSAVTLVSSGSVPGALAYSNGTVTGGSPATALALSTGSISGAISVSTGPVQTLVDNLNALANQIVTSVNGAYNPSNTAGDNFFLASGTTAGTISLDPNLTNATITAGTDGAGDNSIALAVAAVANKQFSTANGDSITGTISQSYANTVSTVGQALDTANTQVTDQTAVQNIVTQQRASVSGVSLNEEMSNLITYQQAFQAASEVFSIVSTLLTDVVTGLGSSASA